MKLTKNLNSWRRSRVHAVIETEFVQEFILILSPELKIMTGMYGVNLIVIFDLSAISIIKNDDEE